ncbi:DUF4097 family beta strand repeat protein [Enterococcus sp. BWB1-3]|uniref:DUF4097 family beta strand repeat-containing protein n=1 Tax=unclassified Enterococcus TaxID=2608891 RepID=UPI0019228C57|nr:MULTISPECIES: DUF4097 family beta strand repeat-containing protein [unclassified Enterococcus]MBL1227661.1 DUF4097 family beta strand repeat protein [Enterococcus sp. BWB1-3]MCB5952153.1 DUF4097 domain-containing protein [Enterococcus sp. BWT-B8]MCB5954440.1 DUF4097 domain-containing protein [Enterococcus sp. CWB-B31]
MKKVTIFFLILGILAIAVGGIGSAVFYQRAKISMVKNQQEAYTIKNKKDIKELHLTLSGNAAYILRSSTDNQVSMNTQSSVTTPINSSFDAKESKETLTVSVSGNQKNETFEQFDFQFFHLEDSQIELTIPADIERLVIDGDASGTIDVYDFITTKLEATIDHADINFISNTSEEININSRNGYINIYGDSRIEKLSLKSEYGNTSIYGFTGNEVEIITSSGNIDLNDVKTSKLTADSKNGEFYIIDLRGDVELTGKSGSIYLAGENLPKKMNAVMEHGDIEIDLPQGVDNITIKAESELGDVDLLDEESSTYKRGKNGSEFELKTNTGDISVYDIYYYEEEYEEYEE